MVHPPELVVAGGDGAILLEPIQPPLHAVALAVGRAIEPRATALIGPGRDHRADPSAAQALARRRAAVALVPGHAPGPPPGRASPRPAHRAPIQQVGHGELFVALA